MQFQWAYTDTDDTLKPQQNTLFPKSHSELSQRFKKKNWVEHITWKYIVQQITLCIWLHGLLVTSKTCNYKLSSLILNCLRTNKWYVTTGVTYMVQSDTVAPAFLLQPARCGVSCLAHYKQRMSTAKHREEKDITCIKMPHLFRLCPHLKESIKGHCKSVPLGGGRQRTGGLDRMVMGGLWEAQPPLDKLELQTVETREIRMEPCLLCLDLEDRARSGSSSTVQLPRQAP